MGIGDIIKDHVPSPSNTAEGKARKEKLDEIVKEIVPEAAAPPKKKPGRPRKNSDPTPGPSQTPPPTPKSPRASTRGVPDLLGKQQDAAQTTAEQVANDIENQAVIRELMMYCRKFPQFSPPPTFNPYLYTPEGNRKVIDAIKNAVHAEVEFLTAPALITDSFAQAERGAMFWAMTNQDNPLAPLVAKCQNATNAILSDPAVDLDVKLLECQISGFMPKNPTLRLCINIGRVLLKTIANNSVVLEQQEPAAYSEF